MKKVALLSLCLMIFLLAFAGCGTGKSEEKPKPPAKVVSEEYEYPRFKIEDPDGNIIITEADLVSVEIMGYDEMSLSYSLELTFNENGTGKFAEATSVNIGEQLPVYCDGVLLMAPIINEAITDGKITLTGIESAAEMQDCFEKISAVMHGEEK